MSLEERWIIRYRLVWGPTSMHERTSDLRLLVSLYPIITPITAPLNET